MPIKINGKIYVTLSKKGIANGRSEAPNNNADFGPDSRQEDGSPTKTDGVQEAKIFAKIVGAHVLDEDKLNEFLKRVGERNG